MIFHQRMVSVLLFASLQWTTSYVVHGSTSTDNDKTTAGTSALTRELARTVATGIISTVTSPAVTQDNTTSTATERDSESSSVNSTDTLLVQTSMKMNFSTEAITQSFTSDNKMSSSSRMTSTTSNLLTISESHTEGTYTNPSKGAPNSLTTNTYADFTTVVTDHSQTNGITVPPPISTTSDMSLIITNNAKTVLTTNVQMTSLRSSFSDHSAESRESQKENHIKGGIIFGAIVGAVLGAALIGLVAYFICGKRKTEGFVHQRLYDDTRNEPVLRLDNSSESYGASFADLSYHNPSMVSETTVSNSNATPYDAIPMDDMTSSPHLV